MAENKSTMHLRETQDGDYPYFRRLWNSVVVALLAASFIPLLVIGGGMYYHTVTLIEAKTLASLRTEVSYHRKAMDEFLAERTLNLKLLASNLGLDYLTAPGNLEKAFNSMQGEIPCFTDLGIIDDQGRHLAYTGPYDLLSKNYREAPWFRKLMERDVYISDVFLGFRNEPHFIIVVKQASTHGFWIIRATVDTEYFNAMVKEVLSERRGDAFIVSREGYFQTSPRSAGKIMDRWEGKPLEDFQGVKTEKTKQNVLVMASLTHVPWVCVAEFDRREVYRALRNTRNVAAAALGLGALIIVLTVLLTTNYLFTRLETKRRSIRFLDQQLRHSSRMASSAKLADGFVREIKDALSNIDLVTDWVKELSRRDLSKDSNREELRESLKQVKDEVARTRKSTERFFKATRPSMPVIEEVRVNDILDEIVELMDREFHFNRITVKRSYAEPPPVIRSDPSQLRQVFQNLILNAVAAIRKDGEITLEVRPEAEGVSVTVSDTGPGIQKDLQAKIFDPLFTTRPDGTGLGLAVSAGIAEKLGGRISVRSEPGKGATFTVELPARLKT
ncbi:MAG: ATP-binding protein [Desulfatiglandales bacterium]